jgi:ribulose-5-phosphate 4-epimerase/fuculose-1-phosphate aldolase
MEQLIKKYADKLVVQGLCEPSAPLMGGLDADLIWSREGREIPLLTKVFNALPINSLLFSEPAEPFRSIINFLSEYSSNDEGIIRPEDTETRTFLHDIPVVNDFNTTLIVETLKKRKAAIIRNRGIISFGIVSPEQAFITYSSVCFSCFVKFFVDHYYKRMNNVQISPGEESILHMVMRRYGEFIYDINLSPTFLGPFADSETVINALIEAGRMTVDSRMVDSFFGNISYRLNNTIYISQTGSSLDELAGYIDPCPIDNTTTAAITASSEFKAHKLIYESCSDLAILHGHPKFAVILSMMCDKIDCKNKGKCHIKCTSKRSIGNIPIIPGEVGTGPTGLSNTLPPAMKDNKGVIVFGHGLFTKGENDFKDAFNILVEIEKMCFERYKSFQSSNRLILKIK